MAAVELGEQVAGAALQVGAGEVEAQVGEELSQGTVIRRLPEVLRVLVQPRPQDGGYGAEWGRERNKSEKWRGRSTFNRAREGMTGPIEKTQRTRTNRNR